MTFSSSHSRLCFIFCCCRLASSCSFCALSSSCCRLTLSSSCCRHILFLLLSLQRYSLSFCCLILSRFLYLLTLFFLRLSPRSLPLPLRWLPVCPTHLFALPFLARLCISFFPAAGSPPHRNYVTFSPSLRFPLLASPSLALLVALLPGTLTFLLLLCAPLLLLRLIPLLLPSPYAFFLFLPFHTFFCLFLSLRPLFVLLLFLLSCPPLPPAFTFLNNLFLSIL